jgi:Na+-transporting NADH:ubiquinone oxidoreductase subunit F
VVTTVVFGILGFTLTIVVLTALLLVVKAKLSPGGRVKVGINGDPEKTLEVDSGSTLLGTLAANGIFIPSACGGKGGGGGGARCCRPRSRTSHLGRRARACGWPAR